MIEKEKPSPMDVMRAMHIHGLLASGDYDGAGNAIAEIREQGRREGRQEKEKEVADLLKNVTRSLPHPRRVQ